MHTNLELNFKTDFSLKSIPLIFHRLANKEVFLNRPLFSKSESTKKSFLTQDEKTNLHQICLVQICCKYEICKALQPVQRWQWPNLHKNGQIRPLPPLHWLQSFANFIFATYLHQANLGKIQFFIQCKMHQ